MRRIKSTDEANFTSAPTCHVQKRSGDYHVTMKPLKDLSNLGENESPYIKCKPMQWKITKNRTDLIDSSSGSEVDIEFTAPAPIIKSKKKKTLEVNHIDCQYDEADFSDTLKKKDKKRNTGKKLENTKNNIKNIKPKS